MVNIEYFYTDRMYRYLWLKSVTGVNLSVHCARSLIGKYDPRFHGYMQSAYNIELLPAPFYYLCGVSHDREWKHNLHLAFSEEVGSEIVIDDEFCRIKIDNARRIEITNRYIDWRNPLSRKKEYCTCRNWQFAYMLASKGLVPQVPFQTAGSSQSSITPVPGDLLPSSGFQGYHKHMV